MGRYIVITFGLLAMGMAGCRPHLSPREYEVWIENPENGLLKFDSSSVVVTKVRLKPLPYAGASEQQLHNQLELDSWVAENEDMIFMDFHIAKPKSTTGDQGAMDLHKMSLLAGSIKDCFKLHAGDDSLDCLFAHYESAGAIWSEYKFLIGFSGGKNVDDEEWILEYIDKLFDTGSHYFHFDGNVMSSSPYLKIE